MLISLGVMLFVGFVLTSTVSYLVSRDSIRKAILQNELPLSSNNIYSEIQRDLFEPILISSLMANDTFVKDWILDGEKDDGAIIRYLKHIQEKYGTITSFLVSEGTRNYYQSNSLLKVVRENNPLDAWFFRVRKMQPSYEINVDPDMANKDAMTIFINYRILDKEGNFLGATGVGLTVNAVKALMQDYRNRYHRDVYFYNRQGNLVLHSLGDDADVGNILAEHRSEDLMRSMLAQIAEGKTNINFSGVGKHGAMANYRYIPELDWILVVEQTSDGTRPLFFKSLGLNLLICLLTAILLLSIIRKTVLRYQQNLESRNQQLQQKNIHIEKQAAELADANRKLDAMHREKDEFIGITVHDLKNPLASVLGFSELVLQERSVAGETREYVNNISLSSRSMLEQVEDLLKLTELESPTEVQLENIDAVAAVRRAARDHDFQAKAKEVLLSLELPDGTIPVRANEKWLISSVGNLISNAIKYSPRGSNVTMSIRRKGKEVEISVTDQGEGIAVEEKERLFRKFERLSPRPTAGESSSGLGLYLVQQMVSRMGGRVWCESEKAKGSTFSITVFLA
jgi:signal transduction histidine kinase